MAALTISGLAVAVDFGEIQHAELAHYRDVTKVYASGAPYNANNDYEANQWCYTLALHMRNGDIHKADFPTEADATRFVTMHKSRFRRATIVWLGTKLQ